MTTNALVKMDDAARHDELIQLVSFMLADEEYGVEVLKVREIQPPPSLVLSGGIGREFVTGVFNHSERLLIIMDVDRMFSDDERESLGGIEAAG